MNLYHHVMQQARQERLAIDERSKPHRKTVLESYNEQTCFTEDMQIARKLESVFGNQTRAALVMGVTSTTLRQWVIGDRKMSREMKSKAKEAFSKKGINIPGLFLN